MSHHALDTDLGITPVELPHQEVYMIAEGERIDRGSSTDRATGRAAELELDLGLGHGAYVSWKVVVDFVLAILLLVLTAPLVLMALILVQLTSRGPAIYAQTRLGRHGRPFTLYKLRTMAHDCERETGPRWATSNDPRITRVGRFLRSTHLDELPQLWNVLRGEMSLVGPRPERPEFVRQLERAIPLYRQRLQVRPGLTGLAQVQLPPDTDLAGVRRKLARDVYYIQHLSLGLDLRILMGTATGVLGIPFGVARVLFRVPSGEIIDDEYQNLAAAESALAGATPA
jgi:lipopolysaccharide/colanic/teichoic acid biosynthesis glycosyltransferase